MVRERTAFPKLAALLAVCSFILYTAFPTRTYYWDGVLFSLDIQKVYRHEAPFSLLFHPNHLLYSVFGYGLYAAALGFGLKLRALTVLQVCNMAVSSGAGISVFSLARRSTKSDRIALFSWVLFAFGATWWKFSTDADSYILSVFLLLLTFQNAVAMPVRVLAATACHAAAMLFHELAIFAYAPVLAAIAFDKSRSNRRRWWAACVYAIASGGIVTFAYAWCYKHADRRTYPTLFAWITSYTSETGFTHSVGQLFDSYLTSFVKLFLGGKLTFIRQYLSPAVLIALFICVVACVAGALLLRRTGHRNETRPERRIVVLLWLWLLPSAVFLALWEPGSAFHKLFIWPPVVLLIATYVSSRQLSQMQLDGIIALSVGMLSWNFAAFIFPHSHPSADPVLMLAQRIDRELPKGATVYFAVLGPDDWYLEYFAAGRNWQHATGTGKEIIERAKGTAGVVCLETTALQAIEQDQSAGRRVRDLMDPRRRWDLVNKQHNVRLECLKESR